MVETMEIQKGLRQTEIGIIPSDWEVKKLINIAQICTGSTPPTSDQNNYGHDYFFVTPADLGKEKIIRSTEKKLSLKGFNLSRKYPKSSILFTCIGSTIGKCGVTERELTSNQQINAVLPNSSFNSDYLYYTLNLFSNKIKKSASETAVPIINKTAFGKTPIPLPPTKAEQAAISTTLNDADALITQLEKLIAKKRAIKQGVMQELLAGKKRLPGFEKKKGCKHTEVGIIPNDWEVIRIGKVFEFKNGLNKEKSFFGKGTPIVNYMDVYKNSGIRAKDITGKVTLTNQEIKNYEVRKGDILFTRTSETVEEIGITSVVLEELKDTVFSGFVLRARPFNSTMEIEFCRFSFSSKEVRKQIISKASYTTRALTNGRLLSDVRIPLPTTKVEQTRIAQILSDMDTEIEALEKKLEKYKMIKQGMMQNLLTGKIRLV